MFGGTIAGAVAQVGARRRDLSKDHLRKCCQVIEVEADLARVNWEGEAPAEPEAVKHVNDRDAQLRVRNGKPKPDVGHRIATGSGWSDKRNFFTAPLWRWGSLQSSSAGAQPSLGLAGLEVLETF